MGHPHLQGNLMNCSCESYANLSPSFPNPLVIPNPGDMDLSEGTKVNHTRFGKGVVLKLEGVGNDKKAEIRFEKGDIKKLLLRFAKLEILS